VLSRQTLSAVHVLWAAAAVDLARPAMRTSIGRRGAQRAEYLPLCLLVPAIDP